MKSVLFSINKPHTDHIRLLLKKVELRTKPPKIDGVYKGFIYETKKYGGCGKVIGEFTAYNENTYRICMGVPAHLAIEGWLSTADILKYSDNGKKDITAISISDLIIYKVPKELSEFSNASSRLTPNPNTEDGFPPVWSGITRPPQSWCYVEKD